jgi:hypothetical protein
MRLHSVDADKPNPQLRLPQHQHHVQLNFLSTVSQPKDHGLLVTNTRGKKASRGKAICEDASFGRNSRCSHPLANVNKHSPIDQLNKNTKEDETK